MSLELHLSLLTPGGMASARRALLIRHSWFLHVSEVSSLEPIKTRGLEPRNPGGAAPDLVIERLGPRANEIICLRPSDTFDTTPQKDGKRFLVAVRGDDLPARIGLDWSFPYCWNLAAILKQDHPAMTDDQVFCETMRRAGSLASYEPIPPSVLHAWSKGTPRAEPWAWPKLADVDFEDIEFF
jgi:hypothetical protein